MKQSDKVLYAKFRIYLGITVMLSFLIYPTACNKNKNISNPQVIIKLPDQRNGEFHLENYVDSTIYVKLETSDDCLIQRINRISVFENKIYIHDSKMKSVIVFDLKGIFLFKIQKVGMGPEEYNDITSFCIDGINKNIVIHDISKNSIYKYCAYNGKFKEVVRIKERKSFARDILMIDNGEYLCYSNEYPGQAFCGIWLLNEKGDFKKHLWKQTKVYPVTPIDPSPMLLKEINDGVYSIFDVINNIIYHYDGLKLIKAYQFDFSQNTVSTLSDYPGITNMKRFNDKIVDIIDIAAIQETSNYIWTTWLCNQVATQTFYIKKDDKLIMAKKTHLIDGIMGNMKPTNNRDIICFEIGAWECADLLKNDKNNQIAAVVKSLISKTNPLDNPIIQILYMKK